jgi:DNA-binding MarR family transcriptional regulator
MGDALRRRIQQSRFESVAHEALLNLLVAADHLRARSEQICAEFGLSASQYNVLRILRGIHPEGHSRCEIARRMIERAPDVTRLIDRLERRGWVERDRCERDRRLLISRITAAGLELLERIGPSLEQLSRELAERMPPEDCRELSRICEEIYAAELAAPALPPETAGDRRPCGPDGSETIASGSSPGDLSTKRRKA